MFWLITLNMGFQWNGGLKKYVFWKIGKKIFKLYKSFWKTLSNSIIFTKAGRNFYYKKALFDLFCILLYFRTAFSNIGSKITTSVLITKAYIQPNHYNKDDFKDIFLTFYKNLRCYIIIIYKKLNKEKKIIKITIHNP